MPGRMIPSDKQIRLTKDREEIMALTNRHAEVHGLHDLRSRRSGTATFIQLHLELDDDLKLFEAHRISDEVEKSLQDSFPSAEIIIHIDPVSAVPKELTQDPGT